MGQSSNNSAQMESTLASLTIIKHHQQFCVMVNRKTKSQYMLIKKIVNDEANIDSLELNLRQRKFLESQNLYFFPRLIEYSKEVIFHCTKNTCLTILFQHPAKSLKQQITNRIEAKQNFEQGELLMIIYCCLMAMKQYKQFKDHYQINVKQENIYIDVAGNIILSDAYKYYESQKRPSLSKKFRRDAKSTERIMINELGLLIKNIIELFSQMKHKHSLSTHQEDYSPKLLDYIDLLYKDYFKSYDEALKVMMELKKNDHSTHESKSISLQMSTTPLRQKQNKTSCQTPIYSLLSTNSKINCIAAQNQSLSKQKQTLKRQPLIRLESNIPQSKNNNQTNQVNIKSFCYMLNQKKKEINHQPYAAQHGQQEVKKPVSSNQIRQHSIYKTEQNEMQIGQQPCINKFSNMPNITEINLNRLTEEDELAINQIINQNINLYSDEVIDNRLNFKNHKDLIKTHIRELFQKEMYEKLSYKSAMAMKQLIFNQKDIIYEQSQNDVSSLASHRTLTKHNRNLSNAFFNSENGINLTQINQ